ncbi:hypothetical protein GGI1_11458 [Acidithiobacillus sp. GGI-221]|nr:hypothetical protein GGI1_11458 [Acidithiobacillus sp. GGI-221]
MKRKIITMTHNTLMTLRAMLRDSFGKQGWKEVRKTLIIESVIIFAFAFAIFVSRWIIGDVILILGAVIFPLVLMSLITCDGLDVDDNIMLVTLKFFIFVVDVFAANNSFVCNLLQAVERSG